MFRHKPLRRSILPSLLTLAAPAAAVTMAGTASAQQGLDEAQPLRNGQYLWDEAGVSAPGAVSISVNIPRQRIHIYRDARLIGISTVSTGAKGHSTPPGDFTILQKNMWHRSNLYSNAPMPYMQRLTWTGIAIHGGHLPGYPASHGCIRLPTAFAKRLFGITTLGVPVTVVGADRSAPLIKLQFADIEWLASDEVVLAPLTERGGSRGPAKQRDAYLIDERTLPKPTTTGGPHWVPTEEMEAVRSGRRQPRLDFQLLPQ